MWMLSASSRSRCVSGRTLAFIPRFEESAASLSGRSVPMPWSGVFFDLGLALGAALLGLDADCIDQRLQALAIFLPALDRGLVDRLADLRDARRFHRAVRLVEVDAFVVPRQPEEFDQAPCL